MRAAGLRSQDFLDGLAERSGVVDWILMSTRPKSRAFADYRRRVVGQFLGIIRADRGSKAIPPTLPTIHYQQV